MIDARGLRNAGLEEEGDGRVGMDIRMVDGEMGRE